MKSAILYKINDFDKCIILLYSQLRIILKDVFVFSNYTSRSKLTLLKWWSYFVFIT